MSKKQKQTENPCVCGNELKFQRGCVGNRWKTDFSCDKCGSSYTFYGSDEEALSQLNAHVKRVVAGQKELKYADATLGWGLDVICPYCDGRTELTNQDEDKVFEKAIFNNRWGDLKNVIVTCEHIDKCGKDFLIGEVNF